MASDFVLTSTTAVGAGAVAAPPPAVAVAAAVAGGASGASNFKFVALGPSWMLPSQDVSPGCVEVGSLSTIIYRVLLYKYTSQVVQDFWTINSRMVTQTKK